MKRFFALLLVVALFATSVPSVYASGSEYGVRVESADIDGEIYRFETSYDANGNTHINILDEAGDTQVLVYSVHDGVFYLDGDVIGTITRVSVTDDGGVSTYAASDWVYQGSYSEYVTWVKGTTTAVVAAALAAALGAAFSVNIVIATIGASVLGVLASSAVGGTVYRYVYLCQTGPTIQTRVNWCFYSSTGERCPSSGTYIRYY